MLTSKLADPTERLRFQPDQAARHLAAIGIQPDEPVLFATKLDDQRCPPRSFFSTLDKAMPLIRRAIDQRHGVFVAVQDQRAKRGENNVVRVRAVWGEFDQPPTKPMPVAPSIVVSSGGPEKRHMYFAGDPGDPLSPAEAKRINRAIAAEYGADPAATDNARILRLAGTWNFKPEYGAPQPVRVLDVSNKLYGRVELLAAFPPIEATKPPQLPKWQSSRVNHPATRRAERYLVATLDRVCSDIAAAAPGTQWGRFGAGTCRIVGLVKAADADGVLPPDFERHAMRALVAAGMAMQPGDPGAPWTAEQFGDQINRAWANVPPASSRPWSAV